MAVRVCPSVSISTMTSVTHRTSVGVRQHIQDIRGCLWLSVSTHRTSVAVRVCPCVSVGVRQHTEDVRGYQWLSVSTDRSSICVCQHTQDVRVCLCVSISTHISTLFLGLSTLALPVDSLGDFGPRGLSVQYTHDIRLCPSAHTGRPCVFVSTHRTSVAVRVCLCVSVSTHRTSVAVHQYTYQHVGPWIQHADPSRGMFGTHRTSVAVHQYTYQHIGPWTQHAGPYVDCLGDFGPRGLSVQYTQDVRVCPPAHIGRPWLSVAVPHTGRPWRSMCVRVCPSAHTRRPWLSISTHISTFVLGHSPLALPVDCLDDFGPRGLSVQYTKDVRGCPPAHTGRPWVSVAIRQHTQDVCGCPSVHISALHTGRLWVSISTHNTSLAVHQYTHDICGCLCVSVSTHMTSVTVHQYTYQHVGRWSLDSALWPFPWTVRVILVHVGCLVSTHGTSVAVRVCLSVSVSTHRTFVSIHQFTYQHVGLWTPHDGVAASNSAAEPEVDPTPYSTSQGASQDICALNMPYITNQAGLNHEANFYGFYTQEGVQANWNWAKIFKEQEVMNFTIQRFLNPSICEYATLEENSSPKKKRPEPKPIIGVKRSLLAFQKAQDLDKWPRKLDDMINFPKPAKPALHLPYLEDPGFTSNQPQEWQPGDLLSHSEALQNNIGSTMPHWIRRIPIKPKDQVGLHQLAEPTSFKESLQPIQLAPKHLDLSRLLSIESCGVLNPPSFHSNSFAKLERHQSSKQSTISIHFNHQLIRLRVFITCIPSYRPSDHLFGRPIQASIIHLAHPDFQPDVRGCPPAHTGRPWLSMAVRQHTQDVLAVCQHTQDVHVCPSAHTGRPCVSVSTHRTSISTHISTLALPVDCLGDFGTRGLYVQYKKDVRGCTSAHTGRPWVSVSTHRTSVAVHVCPCVSVSTHRTSVAVHQYTYQHVVHTGRPWVSVSTHKTSVCVRQHTQDFRGCPCVAVSTHRTSVTVHKYTYQHVDPWTQHADPSRGLFGTSGAVRVCPCVSVSTHRRSGAVRVCLCVSVSKHMTSMAVYQYTYQHIVHTGCLWVSASTHMTSVAVRVCPSVSTSTHRTSVSVHQYTYQDVSSWTPHAGPSRGLFG
ncbi:hypothetical protein YC2023_108573 [Brassica napus]